MKEWVQAAAEGIRFYFCIVPRGWWKKWPFLPLPSFKYIEYRLHTVYGMKQHGWKRPHLWSMIKDTKRFLLWRRKERLREK